MQSNVYQPILFVILLQESAVKVHIVVHVVLTRIAADLRE
jgi:hypothetical protein